jgi:His/Glu/Gln/Arg/opine family amino acid ABC transporter permease subunit
MFQSTFSFQDFIFLLQGAGVTLALTFWAMLGGTIMGLVFGVVRSEGPSWLSIPIGFLLDIFRSVPLLIQFVLFNSANSMFRLGFSLFSIGCLTLAVYVAAFCTEIVRGGMLAVPVTTRRASRSLGMTYLQDIKDIVFPMALRVALPNWISLALGTMKDTSLVMWIGVIELLRTSQSITTRTQQPMLILLIVGALYFAMSFPIGRLGKALERKWREYDRA